MSRYAATIFLYAFAVFAGVLACNAFVDPFGMYRSPRIEGLNAYKPEIQHRMRLYKAFEVRRVRPRSLILGTSRTHVGVSCGHEALRRLEAPCYNLAFDGATTLEMFDYLRHAEAVRPLRHVVLGLDAYHLGFAPSFARPDFDPLVLRDGKVPSWWRFVTGDLRVLGSLDTLRASVQTVLAQDEAEPSWFSADGQRLGEVFFRRPVENFVRYGPRVYFDEIDRLEAGFQTEGATPRRANGNDERAMPASLPAASSLAYVAHIVEFCRLHDIDLRIFITPAHAHQTEIAAAAGGLPAIEEGKRALVRLLAQDAAAHPGQPAVPLFDFSGYSSVTTEPLPPEGSGAEMRFYWDSSHFKQIVGDYVLDRLFGIAGRQVPADFGTRLTTSNIETALAKQRVAEAAYRRRFPADVASLRALVATALDAHGASGGKGTRSTPPSVGTIAAMAIDRRGTGAARVP